MKIPTQEQLPERNEDLAKVDIEFPFAEDDVSDPEEILPHLLDYLVLEDFSPEEGSLTFLRTAVVESTLYWIWAFTSDGEKCYATATQSNDGGTDLGCEVDYYGLTPEQFILGDYRDCF